MISSSRTLLDRRANGHVVILKTRNPSLTASFVEIRQTDPPTALSNLFDPVRVDKIEHALRVSRKPNLLASLREFFSIVLVVPQQNYSTVGESIYRYY